MQINYLISKGIALLSAFTIILCCLATKCERNEEPFDIIYLNSTQIDSMYSDCYLGKNASHCDKMAWELSFIGEYHKAINAYDVTHRFVNNSKQDSLAQIEDYSLVSARKIILERAAENQVIMFNESHHIPYHRIFVTSLLKDFKALGYTHLGLEGLSREDGEVLMKRGKPITSSGYYIKEPQYANLVKEAIRQGFIIFDYDRNGGLGKDREINQANEIANVIEHDKTAKIIIHAGGGHIREDDQILGGLMAYEFHKLTGINPYTIDQTRFNQTSDRAFENIFYQKIDSISEPSVLVHNKTGQIYTEPSRMDVIVAQARVTLMDGRPSYLNRSNYLKIKKDVKRFINSTDTYPLLVAVYAKNEADSYAVERAC